jgi:hypothetical protein
MLPTRAECALKVRGAKIGGKRWRQERRSIAQSDTLKTNSFLTFPLRDGAALRHG